ncbi:MAG: hypothetical protein ACR2LI_12385 [Propionibacteriaceae bacterium]
MNSLAGERTGEQKDRLGEHWPRDFGRDGVSGLLTGDRALRARDVSKPTADDELSAEQAIGSLLSRLDGRR